MALSMTIAGTSRPFRAKTLSIRETANGRGRLTCEVVSHDGSYIPGISDEVILTESATITSSSVANPTVITCSQPHGLSTGDRVTIAGHTGSTPSLNATHVATVTGRLTFTVPVNVTVGGTGGTASHRIFGGSVEELSVQGVGDARAPLATTIECVDFNELAERRHFNGKIAANTLKNILDSPIISDYLTAYGVTLDPSQVDPGPSIPETALYQWVVVQEVLDDLATLAGNWAWRIDYDKRLRMFAPTAISAPFNVATGDGRALRDMTMSKSRDKYANRVILRFNTGAVQAYAFLKATANFADAEHCTIGSRQYTFQTTLTDVNGNVKIGATAQESLENLIAAINLEAGAGTKYAASTEANTQVLAFYQSSVPGACVKAIAAGASGNSIGVSEVAANASWITEGGGATSTLLLGADEALTSYVTTDDTAEQATHGVHEAVFSVPQVLTYASALSLANGYLAQRKLLAKQGAYVTAEPGVRPGMTQTITAATRSLSGTHLVTEVTTSHDGTETLVRKVSTIEATAVPETFRETYRQWSSGAQSTAVTASVGGGGGGGGVSGSGTAGKIPKWSTAAELTDSLLSESGSTVTLSGVLTVSGTEAIVNWYESDAASNQKYWRANATSATWRLQTLTDAYASPTDVLFVDRSGLLSVGTVVGGTWTATAVGAAYGGTGLNTSAATGVAQVSAGTWSVGTTLQTAVQDNITRTGALNSGSITSGFGAIDVGTDSVSAGSFTVSGTEAIVNWYETDGSLNAKRWRLNASADTLLLQKVDDDGSSNLATLATWTRAGGLSLLGGFSATTGSFSGVVTGNAGFAGQVNTATQSSITSVPNLTTVGTITSGVWNAGAVTSSGGISGTTGTFTGVVKIGNLNSTSDPTIAGIYTPVDGNAVPLQLINSQVSAASSTNETTALVLSWRDAATGIASGTRILAGKEGDYTVAGNANSFLAFHTTSGNTEREVARFAASGAMTLIAGLSATTGNFSNTLKVAMNGASQSVTGDIQLLRPAGESGTLTLSQAARGTWTFTNVGTGAIPAHLTLSADVAGTFTISTPLTVSGATTLSSTLAVTGPATFGASVNVAATQKLHLDGGGDTYLQELSANKMVGVVASTTAWNATTAGVRIGDDMTAGYKLDVAGDARITSTLLTFNNSTQELWRTVWDGSNTGGIAAPSGRGLYLTTSGTASTQGIFINGTGNVGIGTTGPATPLHVHSVVEDNHVYVSSGAPVVRLGNNATLASRTNEMIVALAGSAGNYLAGTVAGDGVVAVDALGAGTERSLLFGTAGAERMRITSAGNVGIGTTGPAYTLDVNGTLGVTGAATFANNVGTSTYASQTTGWRVTSAGEADFRYLYTDELVAKVFIADLQQALAGGQIITKSVAMLHSAFTVPAKGAAISSLVRDSGTSTGRVVTSSAHGFSTGDDVYITGADPTAYNGRFTVTVVTSTEFTYDIGSQPASPPSLSNAKARGAATLTVKDLPSAADMQVFQANDYVLLRSFSRTGGALVIGDCIGFVVSPDTSFSGYQTWTFVRELADAGGTLARAASIAAESVALDFGTSGSGYYEVSAIDGTVNVASITRSGSTATLTTRYAHGFVTGDTVYVSGADQTEYNGSFTITVTSSTAFTYTVSGTPATPATGTILVNETNGTNAPWAQIATWTTAPIGDNKTVRARFGNIRGITGTSEYGILAGTYAATGGRYFRATDQAFELHGISLKLWDGSTNTVFLKHDTPSFALGNPVPSAYGTGTGIWMGNDGGTYKFRVGDPSANRVTWDGSTLNIVGTVTATSGTIGGWTIGATTLTGSSVTLQSSGSILLGTDPSWNSSLTVIPSTSYGVQIDSGQAGFASGRSSLVGGLWQTVYARVWAYGTQESHLQLVANDGSASPASIVARSAAGTNRWVTITAGTSIDLVGPATVSSTLAVTGAATFSSTVTASGNIVSNNGLIQSNAAGGNAAVYATAAAGSWGFVRIQSGGSVLWDTRVNTSFSNEYQVAYQGGTEQLRLTTAGALIVTGQGTFAGVQVNGSNYAWGESGVRSWTMGTAASSGNLTLQSGDSSGTFRVGTPLAALSTLAVTGAATFSTTITQSGGGAAASPYATFNGLRLSGGDTANTIYNGSRDIAITAENGQTIYLRGAASSLGLAIATTTGNATFSSTIKATAIGLLGAAVTTGAAIDASGTLGSGGQITQFGIISNVTYDSAGTSDLIGQWVGLTTPNSTFTTTRVEGLHIEISKGASHTITSYSGITVGAVPTATNSTLLLLGTTTIPSGAFAVRSVSGSPSRFGSDTTALSQTNEFVISDNSTEVLGLGGTSTLANLNWYVNGAAARVATVQGAREGTQGGTLIFFTKPDSASDVGQAGRIYASGGLVWGSPTGGDKGAGSINAQAVYDDNTLLTDWVFDLAFDGRTRHAHAGRLHSLAETGAVIRAERRLPWMPSEDDFDARRGLGALVTGLWQGQEQQQLYIEGLGATADDHEDRLVRLAAENAALKARVAELEARVH